jgi:hypothetical protein
MFQRSPVETEGDVGRCLRQLAPCVAPIGSLAGRFCARFGVFVEPLDVPMGVRPVVYPQNW